MVPCRGHDSARGWLLRLTYRVESDADGQTFHEILEATRALSPVHDTFTRPVGVAAAIAGQHD